MSKPWTALTEQNIGSVPAQLGVFEIADGSGTVVEIGYAGGRELFGLRSALDRVLRSADGPRSFRVELTHGYLTRWEELLMVHQAVNGRLPIGNADHGQALGRLAVDEPAG